MKTFLFALPPLIRTKHLKEVLRIRIHIFLDMDTYLLVKDMDPDPVLDPSIIKQK